MWRCAPRASRRGANPPTPPRSLDRLGRALNSVLAKLANALVVSCQPVPGGPLDRKDIVVAFALAALQSGAAGVRIEGQANVAAVREATRAPIIGLVKRDLANSFVRITPYAADVEALAAAGADIVAFDATDRARPVAAADLCAAAHRAGRLAMADISTLAEASAAFAFGADLVGTTLSGYTGGAEPEGPDFDLLSSAAALLRPVIAEGRIHSPAEAGEAMRRGAFAVVVGSAITRPEHITRWYADAVGAARPKRPAAP